MDIKHAIEEVEAGKAVVMDVRRDAELHEEGKAKGAMHLPFEKVMAGADPNLSKDTKIYTYCRSGGRAGQVKDELARRGYTDVHNLGGLKDWVAAGGTVESV